MKGLANKLIRLIILLCSSVLSYSRTRMLIYYKNKLYSLWMHKEFNRANKDSLWICHPIYLKGGKHITIGDTFACGKRLRLECWDYYKGISYTPKIIIMNNVNIGHDCHIGAINEIYIGNNVLIGSKVYISDHSHGTTSFECLQEIPIARSLYSKGKVIIGDNVWIGEGVVILPNVTIGKNCIIGANAVVTKDFPANCIIGGNPAKTIRVINKNQSNQSITFKMNI